MKRLGFAALFTLILIAGADRWWRLRTDITAPKSSATALKIKVTPAAPALEKAQNLARDMAKSDEAEFHPRDAGNRALEMLSKGSVAQVLTVLPVIAQSPEAIVQYAAQLQSSLCRFQEDPKDELGFEIIKFKFEQLIGSTQQLKPWFTLCAR